MVDFAALWKATAKKLAGEVREVDLINSALRQTIGTLARQRDEEKHVRLQAAGELLRQRDINRRAERQYQELEAERDALRAAIQSLISDLDDARAHGEIYTYGQVQERLSRTIDTKEEKP
jgi:hypothetical protein